MYAAPDIADPEKRFLLRPAQEQGVEGVACVDDAARAVVLYCRLWQEYGIRPARLAAESLLRFLAHMQDEDGRFVNFILDWTGQKNVETGSSVLGGLPWQSRALHALAWGIAIFGRDEWEERFDRGLRWVEEPTRHLDVRAVCVLAALQHWRTTGAAASADRALLWASDIVGQQAGDVLLDSPGVQPVHLWGHLQETALAEAGSALDRADLVAHAQASADALLLPASDWCGTARHVLPFEVSCIVSGLSAVARATGDSRYQEGAVRARSWFMGQNAAGQPVYDRRRGLFYDGIDEGRVSRNSGAESNIEGALALLG